MSIKAYYKNGQRVDKYGKPIPKPTHEQEVKGMFTGFAWVIAIAIIAAIIKSIFS